MNVNNARKNVNNARKKVNKVVIPCVVVVCLGGLTALTNTQGATECVELDKVSALLGQQGGSELQLGQLPPGFPTISWSDDISLFGSVIHQGQRFGSGEVLLESAKSTDMMRKSIIATFKQQGWTDPKHWEFRGGGFTSAQTPKSTVLCHKSEGSVHFYVKKLNNGSLARVFHMLTSQGSPCHDDLPGMYRMPGDNMAKYMPRLSVPDELRGDAGISMGMISSEAKGRRRTSTSLKRGWPIDDVMQHFDQQMNTQGWVNDAHWQGGVSAGSVWRKQAKDEPELLATLSLVPSSGKKLELSLEVIRVDD